MNQDKIGQFIAECRKGKHMTQQELADKLGITDKAISKWENGRSMPDISLLESLTKELDITINELLSGEKLSDNQFKEKAEENLLMMMENSSFTLQERIDYFQKKWKKEHAFELTLEMFIILGIMLFGFFYKSQEACMIAFIISLLWSRFQYNRMMSFIEKNAYGK